MSKFQVGDRVEVIAGPRSGVITTIIEDLHRCRPLSGHCLVPRGEPVYTLDIVPSVPGAKRVVAPPSWLRKIGDGFETGSWDEIEKLTKWSPVRVEA